MRATAVSVSGGINFMILVNILILNVSGFGHSPHSTVGRDRLDLTRLALLLCFESMMISSSDNLCKSTELNSEYCLCQNANCAI